MLSSALIIWRQAWLRTRGYILPAVPQPDKFQDFAKSRNIEQKRTDAGVDMDQPCTTPFNAGKLFGGPVLFSDPTIDGLFGNPETFRQFFGRHFAA